MTQLPPERVNALVIQVLEAARKDMGMPKAELARRAGIKPRQLHRYWSGEQEMSMRAADALVGALRLDWQAVVDGARNRDSKQ